MYNSPMCLVHYPERLKAFTQRYGSNAMKKMFKEKDYKEGSIFFRFTNNLRNVNAKTESYYFPRPNSTDLYDCT